MSKKQYLENMLWGKQAEHLTTTDEINNQKESTAYIMQHLRFLVPNSCCEANGKENQC
jgi:hypothetical protein